MEPKTRPELKLNQQETSRLLFILQEKQDHVLLDTQIRRKLEGYYVEMWGHPRAQRVQK